MHQLRVCSAKRILGCPAPPIGRTADISVSGPSGPQLAGPGSMAVPCRGDERGRGPMQLNIRRKCHLSNDKSRGNARAAARELRKSVFGTPGYCTVFACAVLFTGDAACSPCCHLAADGDVHSSLLRFAAPAWCQSFARCGH